MKAIKATRGGAAVALTLIAAVGAGCGSSDDQGTSKADFAKQANAICSKGSKEIKAAAYKAFPGDKQPSGPALTTFVKDTMVPASRKQKDAIKKLDPPRATRTRSTPSPTPSRQARPRPRPTPRWP